MNVTPILTAYHRPETLKLQLEALDKQTIECDEYWLWYNQGNKPKNIPEHPKLKVIDLNFNLKYHGRFALALLARTEYVAILDDDVLPMPRWFENCINSIEKQDGIYGTHGVILQTGKYRPNKKIGWNGEYTTKIQRCDIMCQSWFFKTEHAKYMWYERPPSWDNGEDIHFAYMAQKYGNLNCYVPPHPHPSNTRNNADIELWGSTPKFSTTFGTDSNATYLSFPDHFKIRDEMTSQYIKDGWQLTKDAPRNEQRF